MKKLAFFPAFLALLMLARAGYGLDVKVTDIKKDEGKDGTFLVTAVLNDAIVVKDIRITDGNISYPQKKGRDDKLYKYIYFEPASYKKVTRALLDGRCDTFTEADRNIEITDIKITRIQNIDKLLGFAEIQINGAFWIKSIELIKGEKDPVILFPYRNFKKRREIIYPADKKTEEKIKAGILKKWNGREAAGTVPGAK